MATTIPRRISVIVPTYNNGGFIAQAVDSVFEQRYDNCEIIVVDDGSTDSTASVLARFGEQVKVIRQANAGSAAARNTGLRQATGEYVALLDADDWFLPGKFREQAAILAARPSLGAVHSGWRIVDAEGSPIRNVEPWQRAPKLDLASWLKWKPVKMGAMLFRRAWLERVGYLDPELRQSQDVDLMLRLALAGCRMEWQYEPTLCYRHHDNSTIRKGALNQAKYAVMVLDKFFEDPNVPAAIRRKERFTRYYSTLWVSWHLFRTGNVSATVPYLQKAMKYSPYGMHWTVQDWLVHFAKWSAADGADPQVVIAMTPYFRQAAGMADHHWSNVAADLDWWLNVWRHYLKADYCRAAEELRHSPRVPVQDLLTRVGFFLLTSPQPATMEAVNRFWEDALATGLVDSTSSHEVTSLCLSLFGRTLWSKERDTRRAAIWSACQNGCRPRAWPAWFRFLRAGLSLAASTSLGRQEVRSAAPAMLRIWTCCNWY